MLNLKLPLVENKEIQMLDWTQVLTIFVIVSTNLGTVIALYIQLDKKIKEGRKETQFILTAIQQEMKDFHGRLCTIEERYRKQS